MIPIILLDFVAYAIRWWFSYVGYEVLKERVELSTPINSWKRLQEGLTLYENGISPYEGDTCHTPPLLLLAFYYLKQYPFVISNIFAMSDIIASYCLSEGVKRFVLLQLQQQDKNKSKYSKDIAKILFNNENAVKLPLIVKLCYLFNPFSIGSCVSQTTTTLNNAILAGSFMFMMKGQSLPCLFLVALASYLDFYPCMLAVPIALFYAKLHYSTKDVSKFWLFFIRNLFIIVVFVAALLYSSFLLIDSWQFFDSTYMFIINANDLTPNVGLFWYFFTEMFDPFRLFFLWVFIINPFVYVVPLTLCLRDEPVLLYHQLLMIMAIFKSYPSLGDASVYLSLLPMWSPLYTYIRHGYIVGCSIVVFMVLAPVMWYLWIETGSANANFYFAITLVYSTAQIFLLTDVLYAYLRRRVHLKHGLKPIINEKEAKVVLE